MQVVGSVKRTGLTLLTQRAGRIRIKEKLDKREKKKNRQKNTQRAPRKQHTHTDTRRPHGQSECGHHHPSPPISFLCALYRGAIETSSPPGVARQLKGQKRMSNGTERDLARNADAPWNAAATEGKKKKKKKLSARELASRHLSFASPPPKNKRRSNSDLFLFYKFPFFVISLSSCEWKIRLPQNSST